SHRGHLFPGRPLRIERVVPILPFRHHHSVEQGQALREFLEGWDIRQRLQVPCGDHGRCTHCIKSRQRSTIGHQGPYPAEGAKRWKSGPSGPRKRKGRGPFRSAEGRSVAHAERQQRVDILVTGFATVTEGVGLCCRQGLRRWLLFLITLQDKPNEQGQFLKE